MDFSSKKLQVTGEILIPCKLTCSMVLDCAIQTHTCHQTNLWFALRPRLPEVV